jgi:hypothetical protein
MSSDVEKLLIRCGLPQYHAKFLAANIETYAQLYAKRDLLPTIVQDAAHLKRVKEALGDRGDPHAGDYDCGKQDPVEAELIDWERKIRERLRMVAEKQADLKISRVAPHGVSGPSTSSLRGDIRQLQGKIEKAKTLLAMTRGAMRAHRKYTELGKLLYRYRNRAGDPAEVAEVERGMKENADYVKRILVTLQEQGKTLISDEVLTAAMMDAACESAGTAGESATAKHVNPRPPTPNQKEAPTSGSNLPFCVSLRELPPQLRITRLEQEIERLTRELSSSRSAFQESSLLFADERKMLLTRLQAASEDRKAASAAVPMTDFKEVDDSGSVITNELTSD